MVTLERPAMVVGAVRDFLDGAPSAGTSTSSAGY
jgi:hypothetical protein